MDYLDNQISHCLGEGIRTRSDPGQWRIGTNTRGAEQDGERGSWQVTPPSRSMKKYNVKERVRHGEDEIFRTTNILFMWNAQHSNVCYNVAMDQDTLDLPSWLGVADRHEH